MNRSLPAMGGWLTGRTVMLTVAAKPGAEAQPSAHGVGEDIGAVEIIIADVLECAAGIDRDGPVRRLVDEHRGEPIPLDVGDAREKPRRDNADDRVFIDRDATGMRHGY